MIVRLVPSTTENCSSVVLLWSVNTEWILIFGNWNGLWTLKNGMDLNDLDQSPPLSRVISIMSCIMGLLLLTRPD